MALAWVLRKGKVTSALIGASRPEQVEDCVGALKVLDFSDAELAEIDSYARESASICGRPPRSAKARRGNRVVGQACNKSGGNLSRRFRDEQNGRPQGFAGFWAVPSPASAFRRGTGLFILPSIQPP